jgi:hypothetical protein
VPETTEGDHDMPYLSGVLTGILVTILAVYLIDHFGPQADTQDIVNWNVVAEKLGSASEEVRQEVHEATAPKEAAAPEPTPPPAEPAAPAPAPQTP